MEKNFSDRWLAKMANTDPNSGSTPKTVANTVKHSGLVDEEIWPHEGIKTLEEFYKEIPEDIKEKGLEFLKDYEFGYEYVAQDKIKEALKRSPVSVAVYAWAQNDKGEYIRLGPSGHYVVLVAYDEQDRPIIFDSYESGIKTLEKNYNLEFPQIYVLKKKEEKPKESFWQKLLEAIKKYLNEFLN